VIINRKDPKFAALLEIVRAVDRSYKKHAVIVMHYPSIELTGTYWDGGSRESYALVSLAAGRLSCIRKYPQYAPPQFGGPREPVKVNIEPGFAMVTTGTFCGKPATASLTMSQADFDTVPE
jgi:hypothetical protein